IGSPGVRTMFESHNGGGVAEPHGTLLERHQARIRPVRGNALEGGDWGVGSYDFKPILNVLQRRNFPGWVSLEAFDFTPGAERLANDSLRYLESEIAKLPQ